VNDWRALATCYSGTTAQKFTGIRVGELCGLDRRDLVVGERSRAMRIRADVAKGGREREVLLPKEVRAYLLEYLRSYNNDLVALADILGHASLNTTRHYTRRRKEDLEEGLGRVRYEKGS